MLDGVNVITARDGTRAIVVVHGGRPVEVLGPIRPDGPLPARKPRPRRVSRPGESWRAFLERRRTERDQAVARALLEHPPRWRP